MAKKHNKIKNTGIIYELLVRKITNELLNNQENKSLSIVKEFFNKNSELTKELILYQSVLSERFDSEKKAEKLLDTVVEMRLKLDNNKLKTEKYNLIKKISETYDIKSFFNAKINNYNVLAAISMMFENAYGKVIDPATVVNSRYTLIEHISTTKTQKPDNTDIMQEYVKLDSDIRLLAYKLMLDRFNKKYQNLNESQKSALRVYINNISNTDFLSKYVKEELAKIKKFLKESTIKIEDDILKIKINAIAEKINYYFKGRVDEEHILNLLKYYELIKEIKTVLGK